ncbi:hypothetical protein Cgig2_015899 [Carnegiea gigantea]|uniref:RNA helicase n=1 Tax=Carnegiea gigantea TaxID=171969 RepID=A0A9Q1Q5V7_9CARY|nr:hypothetical protein Cgig2_015899 [Carnegiea gigantea]
MSAFSSLTLCQSAFPSTRQLSPSMEYSSLLLQHFHTLKPWKRALVRETKVLAIIRLEKRIARVRFSASYTKRPMGTAGAYELIDEESGERVIVWGGVDDDDSSIPSKDVLFWNPKRKKDRHTTGTDAPSAVQSNAFGTSTTQKVTSGLGRLKVQKIRSLVRKVSQSKMDTDECKYKELDMDETGDDDDDDDGDETAASESEGAFIRGNRNATGKSGIEQLLDDQIRMKSIKSNAVPSVSASPNGWSNQEPRQSSRAAFRELKHVQKFSAGSDFFSRKFFKDLACSDFMIDSLKALGYVRPSHIQAMAYAPAVEGKSCIIADQSGSGKTLAYLAPVIQRLRQEEMDGTSKSAPKGPRALVLMPTAELASQVLRNCRSISKHGVPFRSMVATGGFRQKTQLESLEQDLDVLIATPGRFMHLIKEGFLHLTNLRWLRIITFKGSKWRCDALKGSFSIVPNAVLDEVDILFNDEDFGQALQSLITSSPFTAQYLFVTATLPVDIYNKLVEIFPDCEVIMGPGMHRTSSGLEEILVDCSGEEGSEKTPETAFLNKKSALLKLAEESRVSKTIVFCNKIETCRKVENSLRRFDRKKNQIRVLPFHAALEQEKRLANMEEFLIADTGNKSLFLICTDRASRGIDFTNVDHVVLFDFPRDPSEYVRRVGRTARGADGKGKAFIFVVGKQVSLARRIIGRNLKGHPLHEVPSAYELVR